MLSKSGALGAQCSPMPRKAGLANVRPSSMVRPAALSSRRLDQKEDKPEPATKLRFYLDSANVKQWELWYTTGLLYGFTTNPSILEKDGVKCTVKSLTTLAKAAFELGAQELFLQSWGDNIHQLSSVAMDLAGIHPKKIVVKLPITLEGVQTAALLRDSNIRVCMTGIYTSHQVLVAQAIGAEYGAPYLGRMNDAYGPGQGLKEVLEMQEILEGTKSKMRLLVASIRDVSDLSTLAAKGCDTFTISPKLASKLFNVNYTVDAAADFEAAAKRNGSLEDSNATTPLYVANI